MKIVRFAYRALFVAAVLVASACEKDNLVVEKEDEKEVEKEVEPEIQKEDSVETRYLVSYQLLSDVSIKDKIEELAEGYSNLTIALLDIDVEKYGTNMVSYRISYNTVDVSGNPVVLSGDICFTNGGLSGKRQIETVSLFHTSFATTENRCCQYEDYAFFGRSIHNALVVFPHYQGFYSGNKYRVTLAESLLKARQAIDCEIAALELIEELDGVEMAPDYCTDNMGISCGTGPTLATHYLLEQDETLVKLNDEFIHLRGSYCCEGPYKYSEIFTYLVDNFPYEDLQDSEDFSQIALISIVVGTFDTWKGLLDSFGNEYFKGIDDVKAYFNPSLFTRGDLLDGTAVVNDVVDYFRQGKLDHHTDMFKNAGLSSHEMINPELLTEDGNLDVDNELIKALYAAFARNEVIAEGWSPKAQLTISHSTGDELCPFEQAYSVYRSLSGNGRSRNVKFNTIHILEHTDANTYYAVRDILLEKHP